MTAPMGWEIAAHPLLESAYTFSQNGGYTLDPLNLLNRTNGKKHEKTPVPPVATSLQPRRKKVCDWLALLHAALPDYQRYRARRSA